MAFNNFNVLEYWNAATNTPKLVSGVGQPGKGYIVSVGGSTSIDGNAIWVTGDIIVFILDQWIRFTPMTVSAISAVLAALPTTLPAAPGIAWNNNGSVSIS